MDANAFVTYLDSWRYRDPGGDTIEHAVTIGGTIPRWKSQLNRSDGVDALSMIARWRHIDAAHDIKYPDFRVPAYDYGEGDAFDKDRPIYPASQHANTDPSQDAMLSRL